MLIIFNESKEIIHSILSTLRDDVNNSKTSIATLNGSGENSIDGKISTKLNSLDTTVNVATMTDNVVSIKQQLSETSGQINNDSSSTITLSKVAKTGVAADIDADYLEVNPETGEITQIVKPVQDIIDDITNQIITLSSKTFKYVVPTNAGSTPRGFRHYYSATQSYNGSLNASSTTVSNIYLCKTESYTGDYHQIVTIVNGSTYSWLDITASGIDLSGFIKTITINGKQYKVNGSTDNVMLGNIINSITGEQDISVAGNSDFVSVLVENSTTDGIATTNLTTKVKVVDIDRTSESVDGLASAKNVKDYVKENSTTFRTWTEDDIIN